MSLALFRDRIEAGDVDETVRAHLRGCDECRARYDQLKLTARALGDDGANEEQERLMKSLPLPRRGEGRGEGKRALYAAAAAIIIAVAVTLLLVNRPSDEVTMRGATEPQELTYSLRVYGKDAPGEKVRLIADFPGSKEASVGMRAELQYVVKPGTKTVLVETRGMGGQLVTARSEPGAEELAAVGKAFPVGAFGPGNIEVCVAEVTPQQQTIDEAVKAGATKRCSTLLVSP